MKLLHIDSSPRTVRSVTRKLGANFIAALREKNPNLRVIHRDVGHHPPPFISDAWVGAAFTKGDQNDPAMKGALLYSDELTTELIGCDRLVIGSPMHNFIIPASLKAWVDQVVRTDITFKITASGAQPLLKNKKAVIVTSRGGLIAETTYDFQEPYMIAVLSFIGITDITFIHAEGVNISDEERESAISHATNKLRTLANDW